MSSVAVAEVPKVTVICGNSFGSDNYMMVNIWHVFTTFGKFLFHICYALSFKLFKANGILKIYYSATFYLFVVHSSVADHLILDLYFAGQMQKLVYHHQSNYVKL